MPSDQGIYWQIASLLWLWVLFGLGFAANVLLFLIVFYAIVEVYDAHASG